MGLWYISFAGNEGFRGATVVEARSAEGAHVEATRRDLNPGGEAAILPVLPGDEKQARAYLNRLVSEGELIADGGKRNIDLPSETQETLSAATHHICQELHS